MLLSASDAVQPKGNETIEKRTVRFRTVGDMTLTGCVESTAANTAQIIDEIAIARVTARGATRGDDRFSEAAMEARKKEGYFCWPTRTPSRPPPSTTTPTRPRPPPH